VNLYKQLLNVLPQRPLQVGDVVAMDNGVATIEMPGGYQATARGEANVGDRVYFRDGAIEGPAPDLPVEIIDI
jgi:ligand-binding SRPBCC domain-containing protein